MPFVNPTNGPVSRYSECLACGAWEKDHLGYAMECPESEQYGALFLDEGGEA